jgi:hypothetical protein
LRRMKSHAFAKFALISITISQNIEVLCLGYLSSYASLSSVSFESDSRLKQIESQTFH